MDESLKSLILNLWNEEENDELYESFEIIDYGKWINDGKYDERDSIVKYKDRYFNINQSRSGSYFTDYDYGDQDVWEVEPFEETITVKSWRYKE